MKTKFRIILSIVVLCGTTLACAGLLIDYFIAYPTDTPLTYVGSDRCRECHEEEYELWRGSDHDMAIDLATEETVLGDFDDGRFTHFGFDQIIDLKSDEMRLLVRRIEPEVWALALKGIREDQANIDAWVNLHLTVEQGKAVKQASQWNKVVRPCDSAEAWQTIGDEVRKMQDEGIVDLSHSITTRFFKKDGEFFTTTEGPDGEMTTYPIKYVFGVWPLQQYLIEMDAGKIQCLGVAWDSDKNKWYHLYPGERIPAHDILHWTKPPQNWNYMCAECHTTNLRKSFDDEACEYRTEWSETHVGCETCHGPGSLHCDLADSKSPFWDRRLGFGLPNLKDDNNRTEIETCAPCHSHRRVVYPNHRDGKPLPQTPGQKFLDYYVPAVINGNLYYADGQILEEDYVYGSFIQSKMYEKGVRCSDCHDPHSLKVRHLDPKVPRGQITTNEMCTDCHMGMHPVGQYDTPSHHHHPDSSQPGTMCVECHMPETTYMVADPRRDHSMLIPRPDLTTELGIPNACNGCHNDESKGETPEWAQAWIEKWYPNRKTVKTSEHHARAIDAGRHMKPGGEKLLRDQLKRSDISGSIRASAILLLANYPSIRVQKGIVEGLTHEDELVRTAAAQSIPIAVRNLTGVSADDRNRELYKLLAPLLFDPIRSVRLEAVRTLTEVPREDFAAIEPATDLPAGAVGISKSIDADAVKHKFDMVMEEYVAGQQELSDQAAAHVNLSMVYQNLGRHHAETAAARMRMYDRAEQELRTAIRIDSGSVPARNNLAMLLDELARLAMMNRNPAEADRLKAEAAEQFREILRREPDLVDAHYSLGLLLAEKKEQLEEAVKHLGEAARLAPERTRIRYNYALALQELGRLEDAAAEFMKVHAADPTQPDGMYALAILYIKSDQWSKAGTTLDTLLKMRPRDRSFTRLKQIVFMIERLDPSDPEQKKQYDQARAGIREMLGADP